MISAMRYRKVKFRLSRSAGAPVMKVAFHETVIGRKAAVRLVNVNRATLYINDTEYNHEIKH